MGTATNDMQISEHELAAMTRDLDELHHASLASFRDALSRYSEAIHTMMARTVEPAHGEATRRSFLRGGLITAGAVGGGAVLAACGSSTTTTSSITGASPTPSADLDFVRLGASLEVLAVAAYGTALTVATSGALGTVPPALAAFVTTAKEQHGEHEAAWNGILTKNRQPEQTAPDPALSAPVQAQLKAVTGIPALATLALGLENVALQTYVNGAGLLQSADARLVALTIAPVEAQHAAILNYLLGQYPVPDSQIPKDKARVPGDLTATPEPSLMTSPTAPASA